MSTMTIPTGVQEMIHGVLVSDPYRWLEDRSLPETQAWLNDQAERHAEYFSNVPGQAQIEKWVRAYLDAPIFDQLTQVGDQCFYRVRRSGEEQASLCVYDTLTGIERVLVAADRDDTFRAVSILRISDDASLLAFEVRHGGEDKRLLQVVRVTDGYLYPESIGPGSSRGMAFAADGSGLYYCIEVPGATEDHEIRFHAFETDAGLDAVLFTAPRVAGSRLIVTAEGERLGAIYGTGSSELLVSFYTATASDPNVWTPLFERRAMPFSPFFKAGRTFVFAHTPDKLTHIAELADSGETTRVVVPPDSVDLTSVLYLDGVFWAFYDQQGSVSIRRYTLEGEYLGHQKLPSAGTVAVLSPLVANPSNVFYQFESFLQPPVTCSVKPVVGPWQSTPPVDVPSDVMVQEVVYPGKDGIPIPMHIVGRNLTDHRTPGPLAMTAYGGFGSKETPQFSVLVTILLKLGFRFAIPDIRGNSTPGPHWHQAAKRRSKQVTFDDFIAAAEWLRSQRYTTPSQLAIFGGSNSGLIVGAVMTQRSELFQAVVCIGPLLDMVRYERFDRAARWVDEYGTVSDSEDFAALLGYSPYHHIREGTNHPATLFISGDKDERCNPAHTRKMVARLQEDPAQSNPILLDYSEQRGHRPNLPLSIRIPALTRRIAFLCERLGVNVPPENSL